MGAVNSIMSGIFGDDVWAFFKPESVCGYIFFPINFAFLFVGMAVKYVTHILYALSGFGTCWGKAAMRRAYPKYYEKFGSDNGDGEGESKTDADGKERGSKVEPVSDERKSISSYVEVGVDPTE
jgi:hypothetical protein